MNYINEEEINSYVALLYGFCILVFSFIGIFLRPVIVSLIIKDVLFWYPSTGFFYMFASWAIILIMVIDRNDLIMLGIRIGLSLIGFSLLFYAFSCFYVAKLEGIYLNSFFHQEYISWKQVKEVEITIDEDSDSLKKYLVYTAKLYNGKEFEFQDNSGNGFGDLDKFDRVLIERNVKFNLDKLNSDPKVRFLSAEKRVIIKRHL